ncbi:hypothetical protein J5N97_000349 [Dioscorea zingiberensis]|uniref:Transcription repressor n=1 Tax=Dioscorea zingiberensis TaxID=325984 RepID=A0A9D5H1L6_9LILI|nr:hypothetical protein J5N97_000349 [Dioscorea zingiberensis]
MAKKRLPKYLQNYISKLKKNTSNLSAIQSSSTTNTCSNDKHYNDDDFSKTPKYEDIVASHRFFSSPGAASSLIEEARLSAASSSTCPRPSDAMPEMPGGGVAMVVHTNDPFCDFRQSMKEMVSSRHVEESAQTLDWEFMEELLLCYLQLNDRNVHKYILRAFAELTVSLQLAVKVE